MSWSWTLYRYLAVQFFLGVAVVYAAFLMLAFSIDIVDLLNRTAGHDVATSVVIGMAVLQLPDLGQKMLPFAILLGGVFTFVRLSRSQELVATRAAGISAWDFLLPPLAVAVLIGVCAVTLFTPVSARMFAEFAGLEARYVKGEASQLSVSQNGLWLRQGDEKQQSVIHALRVADQGQHLEDVMVFLYGANDHFIGRIDAKIGAAAATSAWLLNDACVSGAGGTPVHHDHYQLATTLTPEQIQESFASPDTLSFWDLPGYHPRRPGRRLFGHPLPALSLYALRPAGPVRGHGVHGGQLLAAARARRRRRQGDPVQRRLRLRRLFLQRPDHACWASPAPCPSCWPPPRRPSPPS